MLDMLLLLLYHDIHQHQNNQGWRPIILSFIIMGCPRN